MSIARSARRGAGAGAGASRAFLGLRRWGLGSPSANRGWGGGFNGPDRRQLLVKHATRAADAAATNCFSAAYNCAKRAMPCHPSIHFRLAPVVWFAQCILAGHCSHSQPHFPLTKKTYCTFSTQVQRSTPFTNIQKDRSDILQRKI